MPSHEPKTRHVRAAELRAQLDQMFEQAVTRAYDRESLRELALQERPKGERTATHVAAGLGLGMPTLGKSSRRSATPPSASAGPAQRLDAPCPRQQARRAKPFPLRLCLLSGAALTALLFALLVPDGSAQSTLSTQAAVVIAAARPPRASIPTASKREERGAAATLAERSDWASDDSAPLGLAEAEQSGLRAADNSGGLPSPHEPELGTAPARVATLRQAVDQLIAGRTRDALATYRTLSRQAEATAELAIVTSLLEAELRGCADGHDGGEPCAP